MNYISVMLLRNILFVFRMKYTYKVRSIDITINPVQNYSKLYVTIYLLEVIAYFKTIIIKHSYSFQLTYADYKLIRLIVLSLI